MKAWLGTSPEIFFVCTVVLMGFAAYATGRAVANNWGPRRQVIAYAVLLSAAARFLIYALFAGDFLSWTGWFSDWIVLVIIALLSHRLHYVRKMASQYPWLYLRRGRFGLINRGTLS